MKAVFIFQCLMVLAAIGLFIGWAMNIVKIGQMCCDVTGLLVIRIIGAFIAPLGGVVGYL